MNGDQWTTITAGPWLALSIQQTTSWIHAWRFHRPQSRVPTVLLEPTLTTKDQINQTSGKKLNPMLHRTTLP